MSSDISTEIKEPPSRRAERLDIQQKKANQTETIETYLQKKYFEWKERWGILDPEEPEHALVQDIQEKLLKHLGIPRGEMRIIDSPEINAFVVTHKVDIFFFTGLIRALFAWCERHGKPVTEDKIAFVLAHELTHIEQGTEELDEETIATENESQKHTLGKFDEQQHRINHEYDADRGGLILMAKAGYNPREGIEMLTFIKSLGDGIPLFSHHPRSADRERELRDFVESENTFLSNISRPPRPIVAEMYPKFFVDGYTHPGTPLYRKAGSEHLAHFATQAATLYDALEVALVAHTHDKNLMADAEKETSRVKREQAVSIAIENIMGLVRALQHAYGTTQQTKEIHDWSKEPAFLSKKQFFYNDTLYTMHEFDYRAKRQVVVNDSRVEDHLEQTSAMHVEHQKQTLKAELAKEIQRIETLLASQYPKSPEIETYLRKIRAIFDLFESRVDAITETDLETFVTDTQVQGSGEGEWSAQPSTHTFVQQSEVSDLVKWCTTNGTAYFSAQAALLDTDRPKKTSQASRIVHFESSYEPYLADIDTSHDLVSVSGRKKFVDAIRFQFVKTRVGTPPKVSEEAQSPDGLNRIEKIPFSIPYTESIAPHLVEHFTRHYSQALSPDHAHTLAQFIVPLLTWPETAGLEPATFHRLVADLSWEECIAIDESFPLPEAHLLSSASPLFLEESGFKVSPVILKHNALERFLVIAVKQRLAEGGYARDVNKRLPQLKKLIVLGGDVDAYIDEMQDILTQHTQSVTEIISTVKDVLPAMNVYLRANIIKEIVHAIKKKFTPIELLPLLEGKNQNIVLEYIEHVWTSPERQNLTLEEQFTMLEFLFRNVGCALVYKEDSGLRQDDSDLNKEAVAALGLSAEYIHLYKKVHPDHGIEEAFKILIQYGYARYRIVYGTEPGREKEPAILTFLGDELCDTECNNLSLEQLQNILLWCKSREHEESGIRISGSMAQEITKKEEFIRLAFYRALHLFNEQPVPAAVVLHNSSRKSQIYNDRMRDCAENLEFIITYAPRKIVNNELNYCCDFYNKSSRPERLIDSDNAAEREVFCRFPEITRRIMDPWTNWKLVDSDELQTEAKKYDPKATSLADFFSSRRVYGSARCDLLAWYFLPESGKRRIIDDVTKLPAERIQALTHLIPEQTDYKDKLFAQVEEAACQEYGLTLKGHQIWRRDGSMPDTHTATILYDFYRACIPEMVNQEKQELYSRRADDVYQHLRPDVVTFTAEFERLMELYPHASYARDEALLALGDSVLVKAPDQSELIVNNLFAVQRRTSDTTELSKQRTLEIVDQLLRVLSRKERKDFLLWVIGARHEPPLTLAAFGGKNSCSVEDIPRLIFAATKAERYQFFTRFLLGDNGVMDPKDTQSQVVFQELINETCDTVFPPDMSEIGKTGRELLARIFRTVMQEYSELRRTKIFIALMEVLRAEQDASIGKRIRSLLEALGPVGIKVGQVLCEEEKSPGEYLLPESIRQEMKKMKQQAASFHRTASFQVLEADHAFDRDNPERIVSLEEQLAAASIKQVSRALRADGKQAVEKIRRPSIGKHLEEDLAVMEKVLVAIQDITDLPEGIGSRIGRLLVEEADFVQEVKNHHMLEGATAAYAGARTQTLMDIRMPQIYAHSTERIQEEYIPGLSLEELMNVAADPTLLDALMTRHGFGETEKEAFVDMIQQIDSIRLQAFDVLLYLMFVRGEFHSDPHAGNILITPEKEMVFIDTGSAGKVESEKLNGLKQFFLGFIFFNAEFVAQGITTFVPAVEKGKLDQIATLVEDGTRDMKEKFKQTLNILSKGGAQIDEGFEKCLKGLATGSYLTRGMDQMQLAVPIMAHVQLAS